MEIAGKTALVTRANRGLGRHLAAELRDRGARVCAGVLEPLNDPAFFAALVTVDPESGTVTWPGGIDLAPEPL